MKLKEATNEKEMAEEEVKSITKKLKDALIKLEELQKSDKVEYLLDCVILKTLFDF